MTKFLADNLRADYLQSIKVRMMEQHHNFTSLARCTGYSIAHISNIFKGQGSDDAIAAICSVLSIDIREDLFKDKSDANKTGTEG